MSAMKDHLAWDYPPNLQWYIPDNHIGALVGIARSVPLSPFFRALARVTRFGRTCPVPPNTRACAVGANLPADLAAGDLTNLAADWRGASAPGWRPNSGRTGRS